MFWQQAAFWLFALLAVVSGLMVVTARNPVHSVLFLIFAFFNSAGLFVLMGAEFLGLILVVVYVGAVAVLFLFVVMMLDIDVTELRRGITRYLPVGLMLAIVLGAEFAIIIASWQVSKHAAAVAPSPTPPPNAISNTVALGSVLYTDYVYLFQVAGLILLVAMIGAIVLTLRHREGIRRQSIAVQTQRTREKSVELRKVSTGGGI